MIVDVLIVPGDGEPYVEEKDIELPIIPEPEPEPEPETGDTEARLKTVETELSALQAAIAKGVWL